eukprot:NODE_5974_length_1716_cov_5.666457.p1 GENE.NODE_5974_length_1716_cov_5.666457~~NODE_5974_length_1716_cov_5.666457.p1  ORF type:complete len:541 (-),score=137.00 NODE_5974_length_1716_cov_5.666457:93-1580(-)
MAQLVVKGKHYGFHAFLVQLRDDEGRCMPGVEVGEIGPKVDALHGYIGYARFTHVRIPRFNMLAKLQQVTRDGVYVAAPPKLGKLAYFSMVQLRISLVMGAGAGLGVCATIAIRYSCVRRQGFKNSQAENPLEHGEHPIMDYQLQQYRTLKGLGLAYMFLFTTLWSMPYLNRVRTSLQKQDEAVKERAAHELEELHATSAGLKAWTTTVAHDCMEDLRRACGGQGFTLAAGIGVAQAAFIILVTGEGEHVILSLQTARFLIKSVQSKKAGVPLHGTMAYLDDTALGIVDLLTCAGKPGKLLKLFRDRARRYTLALEEAFGAEERAGKGVDAAMNAVAVLAYKSAAVHSVYILARNFVQGLALVPDKCAQAAMRHLCELVLLQLLRESVGDWAENLGGLAAAEDAALERIGALLNVLRPDAVGLSDALGFPDSLLKSTLGRHDGMVYEAIYESARQSPVNQAEKMAGWEHFAKVLDLDFLREGMRTQRSGFGPAKL